MQKLLQSYESKIAEPVLKTIVREFKNTIVPMRVAEWGQQLVAAQLVSAGAFANAHLRPDLRYQVAGLVSVLDEEPFAAESVRVMLSLTVPDLSAGTSISGETPCVTDQRLVGRPRDPRCMMKATYWISARALKAASIGQGHIAVLYGPRGGASSPQSPPERVWVKIRRTDLGDRLREEFALLRGQTTASSRKLVEELQRDIEAELQWREEAKLMRVAEELYRMDHDPVVVGCSEGVAVASRGDGLFASRTGEAPRGPRVVSSVELYSAYPERDRKLVLYGAAGIGLQNGLGIWGEESVQAGFLAFGATPMDLSDSDEAWSVAGGERRSGEMDAGGQGGGASVSAAELFSDEEEELDDPVPNDLSPLTPLRVLSPNTVPWPNTVPAADDENSVSTSVAQNTAWRFQPLGPDGEAASAWRLRDCVRVGDEVQLELVNSVGRDSVVQRLDNRIPSNGVDEVQPNKELDSFLLHTATVRTTPDEYRRLMIEGELKFPLAALRKLFPYLKKNLGNLKEVLQKTFGSVDEGSVELVEELLQENEDSAIVEKAVGVSGKVRAVPVVGLMQVLGADFSTVRDADGSRYGSSASGEKVGAWGGRVGSAEDVQTAVEAGAEDEDFFSPEEPSLLPEVRPSAEVLSASASCKVGVNSDGHGCRITAEAELSCGAVSSAEDDTADAEEAFCEQQHRSKRTRPIPPRPATLLVESHNKQPGACLAFGDEVQLRLLRSGERDPSLYDRIAKDERPYYLEQTEDGRVGVSQFRNRQSGSGSWRLMERGLVLTPVGLAEEAVAGGAEVGESSPDATTPFPSEEDEVLSPHWLVEPVDKHHENNVLDLILNSGFALDEQRVDARTRIESAIRPPQQQVATSSASPHNNDSSDPGEQDFVVLPQRPTNRAKKFKHRKKKSRNGSSSGTSPVMAAPPMPTPAEQRFVSRRLSDLRAGLSTLQPSDLVLLQQIIPDFPPVIIWKAYEDLPVPLKASKTHWSKLRKDLLVEEYSVGRRDDQADFWAGESTLHLWRTGPTSFRVLRRASSSDDAPPARASRPRELLPLVHDHLPYEPLADEPVVEDGVTVLVMEALEDGWTTLSDWVVDMQEKVENTRTISALTALEDEAQGVFSVYSEAFRVWTKYALFQKRDGMHFFHGDPQAGNLMVRYVGGARAELKFIDLGNSHLKENDLWTPFKWLILGAMLGSESFVANAFEVDEAVLNGDAEAEKEDLHRRIKKSMVQSRTNAFAVLRKRFTPLMKAGGAFGAALGALLAAWAKGGISTQTGMSLVAASTTGAFGGVGLAALASHPPLRRAVVSASKASLAHCYSHTHKSAARLASGAKAGAWRGGRKVLRGNLISKLLLGPCRRPEEDSDSEAEDADLTTGEHHTHRTVPLSDTTTRTSSTGTAPGAPTPTRPSAGTSLFSKLPSTALLTWLETLLAQYATTTYEFAQFVREAVTAVMKAVLPEFSRLQLPDGLVSFGRALGLWEDGFDLLKDVRGRLERKRREVLGGDGPVGPTDGGPTDGDPTAEHSISAGGKLKLLPPMVYMALVAAEAYLVGGQ